MIYCIIYILFTIGLSLFIFKKLNKELNIADTFIICLTAPFLIFTLLANLIIDIIQGGGNDQS